MEREIKFRGKCVGDTGNWIFGYYHFDKQTGKHWIADEETLIAKEVIPETVGQHIGLKDKNGKDIYEGDIVDYFYGDGVYEKDETPNNITKKRNVVKFSNGYFYPKPEFNYCEDGFYGTQLYDFEIIGTVHENKELLNQ